MTATPPPCRTDPELFFDEGNPGRVAKAKKVCAGCPLQLRARCLDVALHHAVEGVWSATTTDERKVMRARAGIVAQSIITNPHPYRRAVA